MPSGGRLQKRAEVPLPWVQRARASRLQRMPSGGRLQKRADVNEAVEGTGEKGAEDRTIACSRDAMPLLSREENGKGSKGLPGML